MTKSLEDPIGEVEARARDDDPDALTQAMELVTKYPADAGVWTLRAYIFARAGDLPKAISDISSAMALSPPEPSHHFDRGRYKFKLGDNAGAIAGLR